MRPSHTEEPDHETVRTRRRAPCSALAAAGASAQAHQRCADRRTSSSPPTRSTSMPASSPRRWRAIAEVKKFGQQMVTDHTGVNKQAVDLVTKLKVTPEDNPTSQSLKAGGDKNVANLKTPEGRRVRQGLHRPRGRLPPGGARRGRQDADPRREQRRAESAAGEGAPGLRRASRACQEDPVDAQVGPRRSPSSPPRWGRCSVASARARRRRPRPVDPHGGHGGGGLSARAPSRSRWATRVVWVNRDPFPHTATSATLRLQGHRAPARRGRSRPRRRANSPTSARCTRR